MGGGGRRRWLRRTQAAGTRGGFTVKRAMRMRGAMIMTRSGKIGARVRGSVRMLTRGGSGGRWRRCRQPFRASPISAGIRCIPCRGSLARPLSHTHARASSLNASHVASRVARSLPPTPASPRSHAGFTPHQPHASVSQGKPKDGMRAENGGGARAEGAAVSADAPAKKKTKRGKKKRGGPPGGCLGVGARREGGGRRMWERDSGCEGRRRKGGGREEEERGCICDQTRGSRRVIAM